MEERAPERCCNTMLIMSTPHGEFGAKLVRDGVLSPEEAETLGPHEPFVEWVPHIGMFCIANVAISRCPWCGAHLPNKETQVPPSKDARPMQIFVGPDGKVEAYIDGKPAPAEATKLLSDNDDGPSG